MAEARPYRPSTTVNWTAKNVIQTFKIWRKVERIIEGPMKEMNNMVKVNHVFIWVGGDAETRVESKQEKDHVPEIKDGASFLNTLQNCLKHCTYFGGARDDVYNLQQFPDEGITSYYSRIVSLQKLP